MDLIALLSASASLMVTALVGVLLVYLVLGILLRRRSGKIDVKNLLRLLPDIAVLLWRLAKDRNLSWWVRLPVFLLILYMLWPFDLIPDYVPILGVMDDILIVTLILQLVFRSAGYDAFRRNWPGNDVGLDLIESLVFRG